MGYLSQVVELSSMLPHNALKVYEKALTPHPKVSRGRGCCVRQHDDVACKVVKALYDGSACPLMRRLLCYCAHASRGGIACRRPSQMLHAAPHLTLAIAVPAYSSEVYALLPIQMRVSNLSQQGLCVLVDKALGMLRGDPLSGRCPGAGAGPHRGCSQGPS